MSAAVLQELIVRMASDAAFADAVQSDPAILDSYDLAPDERSHLVSLQGDLVGGAQGLGSRESKSSIFNLMGGFGDAGHHVPVGSHSDLPPVHHPVGDGGDPPPVHAATPVHEAAPLAPPAPEPPSILAGPVNAVAGIVDAVAPIAAQIPGVGVLASAAHAAVDVAAGVVGGHADTGDSHVHAASAAPAPVAHIAHGPGPVVPGHVPHAVGHAPAHVPPPPGVTHLPSPAGPGTPPSGTIGVDTAATHPLPVPQPAPDAAGLTGSLTSSLPFVDAAHGNPLDFSHASNAGVPPGGADPGHALPPVGSGDHGFVSQAPPIPGHLPPPVSLGDQATNAAAAHDAVSHANSGFSNVPPPGAVAHVGDVPPTAPIGDHLAPGAGTPPSGTIGLDTPPPHQLPTHLPAAPAPIEHHHVPSHLPGAHPDLDGEPPVEA
ncbi:MAG: hypothetical protein QOK05_2807 [Chloroflexota bacterium]|jgi:hypothetical protein|nr:hypothetical protein [Chloroflexota bacterium]